MKFNFKKFTLILIIIILKIFIFSGETDKPLLITKWGQRDEYAKFSPKNLRLGCWSTAFAQILYHYRLTPSGGIIKYRTTTGYKLEENIGEYKFNFDKFINEITTISSQESIDEVAKYIYFCSLIIKKNFGTEDYLLKHAERADKIAEYYNCITNYYSNEKYSLDEIKKIVINEIDEKRPVFIHLRNLSKNKFHAAVIDAYKIEDNRLIVHINMGHKGKDDGWFDFDKPILEYTDNKYRKLITIRPKK